MCGNRVDELESRIKELEASVEGLTDELVECKVRVRELEGAVDGDFGFGEAADAEEDGATESADEPGFVVSGDDESSSPVDTHNTEADKKEDNTEESGSDIIVA